MRAGAGLRVLTVSQYGRPETGGAERYLHEICSRLESQHGYAVHRAATDASQGRQPDLSPARYRLWSAGLHPAWAGELRALIARLRPEVLYVHHTVPGVTDVALRLARQLHLPAEVMYHSDVTGADLPRRLVGGAYQALVGRGSLAAARAVHVASPVYGGASGALRSLGRPLVQAPPGVDDVMAHGQRQPRAPYLLFVGKADVPSKGFAVLHAAWQRLRAQWTAQWSEQWPELELVVVGSGQENMPAVPGLHWAGQVTARPQLADLYASALVTVLPSLSSAESFGMVLAEALVAGCPVVASRIGGLPALVEDGQTGYLAEPGDVASLTWAVAEALTHNARLRAGLLARQAALRRRFSWDATAAVVATSLAGGSGPRGAVGAG